METTGDVLARMARRGTRIARKIDEAIIDAVRVASDALDRAAEQAITDIRGRMREVEIQRDEALRRLREEQGVWEGRAIVEEKLTADLEQAYERIEEMREELYPGKPMHATREEAGVYFAKSLTRMSDESTARELFFTQFLGRLGKGEHGYGDESFGRRPSQLLGELRKASLDMAGWGFVLWKRVQATIDTLRLLQGDTKALWDAQPIGEIDLARSTRQVLEATRPFMIAAGLLGKPDEAAEVLAHVDLQMAALDRAMLRVEELHTKMAPQETDDQQRARRAFERQRGSRWDSEAEAEQALRDGEAP